MNRKRYYVTYFKACWSLSAIGYEQLLLQGCNRDKWDLSNPIYQAQPIKKIPHGAKRINLTNFTVTRYKEELRRYYLLQDKPLLAFLVTLENYFK